MKAKTRFFVINLFLIGLLLVAGCVPISDDNRAPVDSAAQADVEDVALQFAATGETLNVTVDGAPLVVTKYTVSYVANPFEMQGADDPTAWQKMHIYVPATAADDQETAIILAVNNSGWMNSPAPATDRASIQDGGAYVSNSNTDRTGAALAAGYVFVDVGTRGRGLVAADGSYPGKAPAVVVDAKAAIRYLRLNDAIIPGSSERIVITGTSGGGGLSTAIAASGNSPDYFPYLQAIGAAGMDAAGNSTLQDDVFAVIAYCPITDLGNADIAYEWQYSDLRQVGDLIRGPVGFIPWYTDNLTQEMMDASIALKAQYPAYLAGLGLVLDDGTALTAETMPDAITALVKASVENALASGTEVPDLGKSWSLQTGPPPAREYENTWLDLNDAGDAVESINYAEFLKFVVATAPLKGAPSFDVTGSMGVTSQKSGESNLFGSDAVEYSNFMAWAWDNNTVPGDGSGTDDTGVTWEQYFPGSPLQEQIKLINPIAYLIDADNGDSAPHWYVRHGLRDRDTSFAVEVELFYAVKNDPTVQDANVGLAYIQGHSGNYDVQEAYAWLAGILAPAQ
jgi:hypothetical protein